MMATDGMVTLATGQTVPTTSPAWRQECKTRHDHVQALLRMRGVHMRAARQKYLADVERREGAEATRRLKEALLQAWAAAQADEPGGAG